MQTRTKIIAADLKLGLQDYSNLKKNLAYYVEWDGLPTDSYLLDFHITKNGARYSGVYKTFHSTEGYRKNLDGEMQNIIYVLKPKYNGFPYAVDAGDKLILEKAADEVWKKYNKENDGEVVPLSDVVPVMIKKELLK